MKRLSMVATQTYWDTLWRMAVPGSTYATQASELKWKIINDDLNLVDTFSEIAAAPDNAFEAVLVQYADQELSRR